MGFVNRDQRDLQSNSYAAIPATISSGSPSGNVPEKVPAFWLDTTNKRFYVCTTLEQVGTVERGVWTLLGDVSSGGGGSVSIEDLAGGTATALAGDFIFGADVNSGIMISASGNTVVFRVRPDGITTSFINDAAVTGEKIADQTIEIGKLTPALQALINAGGGGGGVSGISINGDNVTAVTDSSTVEWTGTGLSRMAQVPDASITEQKLAQAVVTKLNAVATPLQYNSQDVENIEAGTNTTFDYDSGTSTLTVNSSGSGDVTSDEFEDLREDVEQQKQLVVDLRSNPPSFVSTTDDVTIAFSSSSNENDITSSTFASTIPATASVRNGFIAMRLGAGLSVSDYVVERVDASSNVQSRYFGNTFHRTLTPPVGDTRQYVVLGLNNTSSQEIRIPAGSSLRVRVPGHRTTFDGDLAPDSVSESELSQAVRDKLNATPDTVEDSRIFTSSMQKIDTIAKTSLLNLATTSIDNPISRDAIWGSATQEVSSYTVSSDDLTGTTLAFRIRLDYYNDSNSGQNLFIGINRGGAISSIQPTEEQLQPPPGLISGATDADGNDISATVDFVTFNIPVSSFAENDILTVETRGARAILEVQNQTRANAEAIRNLDLSAVVPEIIRDLGAHLTETHQTSTGMFTRISPDPYADRVTINRQAAVLIDEDRRTGGETGNYFDDITPAIAPIVEGAQFYDADSQELNTRWPDETSYARGTVTLSNDSGETTPITDNFRKIIAVEFRVFDFDNLPTTPSDLIRIGGDTAHPMFTIQKVGDDAHIFLQTVATRSAGTRTVEHTRPLNEHSLEFEAAPGIDQRFQDIPTDWQMTTDPAGNALTDSITLRFLAFRVSDNTIGIPSYTFDFDIPDRNTSVAPVAFTVTTMVDSLAVTAPFTVQYVANREGQYFVEITQTAAISPVGIRLELYVDRVQSTTTGGGTIATYNSQLIDTLTTTSPQARYALTFARTNSLSTDETDQLSIIFANSPSSERNDIDLGRGRGEDGLDFSTVTVNDVGTEDAVAVRGLQIYSYTSAAGTGFIPSHDNLQMAYDNFDSFIGLFLHPENVTDTFILNANLQTNNPAIETIEVGSSSAGADSDGAFQFIAGSNVTLSIGTNSLTISSNGGGGGGGTSSIQYNGMDVATISANASLTLTYNSATETLNFAVTNPATITSVSADNGALTPANRGISILGGEGITTTRDQTNANHLTISLDSDSTPNIQTISVSGTAVTPASQNIDFIPGSNVDISVTANAITISSTDTVPNIQTISVDDTAVTPASQNINLITGANTTLTVTDNDITIASNDTVPLIDGFTVDGASLTPDSSRDIGVTAGDNITLTPDATNPSLFSIASASGGSKTVSESSFTVTAGTAGTEGTPGTYTTYQWYSGGRSRGATTDFTGDKTVDSVAYVASPDAYSDSNANWETTATSSSTNIGDLFDIRGGGRRLYNAVGWSNINAIRDLNDFSMDLSSTGAMPWSVANFTPNSATFPPTTSAETQSVLIEIWRPTSVANVYSLVLQQALDDPDYVFLPDIMANDIFIVAMPSTAPSSGNGARPTIRFRQQLTAPVFSTDPSAGDTAKTSTSSTESFDALTFASQRDRDSTVSKVKLLQDDTHAVIDPEPIPFLFLNRTLETFQMSVHTETLDEFVDNPIFLVRESLYRAFLVGTDTNLRIVRTRGETRETVDDTLSFSPVGDVANATSPTGAAINEPYYCVRATFDIQDDDIFEVEGHTKKNISYPILRFGTQEVSYIETQLGIDPVYSAQEKLLTLSLIPGFASFILRYSRVITASIGALDFNRDEDSFDTDIKHGSAFFDLGNSSAQSSTYVESGTGGGGNPSAQFKVDNRYDIQPSSNNTLVIVQATSSVETARTICGQDRICSFQMPVGGTVETAPVLITNDTAETFNVNNYSVNVSTSANTFPDDNRDVWFALSGTFNAESNYITADQLEFPDGTTLDPNSSTTYNFNLIQPDSTHANTSSDITDIFNFISLEDEELAALNLTPTGDIGSIFMEFKRAGNYTLNNVTTGYYLHIRPTKTDGSISSYTRIGSYFTIQSDDREYNLIHINAQEGDLLLPFQVSSPTSRTSRVGHFLSIGSVFEAGVNPSLTVLTAQFNFVSTSLTIGSTTVTRSFSRIDTANSSSNISNFIRQYRFGSLSTSSFGTHYYNIAKFNGYSFFNPNVARFLFPYSTTEFLGVNVSGGTGNNALTADLTTIINSRSGINAPSFLFLSDIQMPSATHDVLLVQETSTTTNVIGFKYPNNGFDPATSSSNITDIFNTRTLTQAEMRILTGQSTGAFATSNTVLESKIDGMLTVQNGTATGATFSTNAFFTVRVPTYDDSGTLTSVIGRAEAAYPGGAIEGLVTSSSISNTTRVSTVTVDGNGFWPGRPISVKVGDLITLFSSTPATAPIAFAINAVVE